MTTGVSSAPFGAVSAAPRFLKPRITSSSARFLEARLARNVTRMDAALIVQQSPVEKTNDRIRIS